MDMKTEYTVHYTRDGKEYYFIPLKIEDAEAVAENTAQDRRYKDVYIVEREVGEWRKCKEY